MHDYSAPRMRLVQELAFRVTSALLSVLARPPVGWQVTPHQRQMQPPHQRRDDDEKLGKVTQRRSIHAHRLRSILAFGLRKH